PAGKPFVGADADEHLPIAVVDGFVRAGRGAILLLAAQEDRFYFGDAHERVCRGVGCAFGSDLASVVSSPLAAILAGGERGMKILRIAHAASEIAAVGENWYPWPRSCAAVKWLLAFTRYGETPNDDLERYTRTGNASGAA